MEDLKEVKIFIKEMKRKVLDTTDLVIQNSLKLLFSFSRLSDQSLVYETIKIDMLSLNFMQKCECCDSIKLLLHMHDKYYMCSTCALVSIYDRACLNCNKSSKSFYENSNTIRRNGFKCSVCGNLETNVQVNYNCKCIICSNCYQNFSDHRIHLY